MDAAGFLREYESLAPALHAWARLCCQGPIGRVITPEDLEQEVCLAAWAARERFDPRSGAFRPWLFGVASRVAAEALRRLARGRLLPGQPMSPGQAQRMPAEWTTVSRRVRRDEAIQRVLNDLEKLSEQDRQILLYHGMEGLTHAEVAELLGCSEAHAAKRWQRLCARLREIPSARAFLAVDEIF